MIIIILFYGLILGSFYNVVGLRVPEGKSIVSPRSSCPKCGYQLGARDLVPVLSYIFQKGKCRRCKAGISPVYPLFELLTGALFAFAYLQLGLVPELLVALLMISLFVIITVSDLAYMIIPDKVLLVFAVLFIFVRFAIPLDPWWDSVMGAAVGFTLLLLIAIVSSGGMGGGDIKLFGLIGIVLGLNGILLSFFLSTLFGALFGGLGLLLGILKRKQAIPFGPFIAAGSLAAYFFGDTIVRIYLSFLQSGF